MKLHEYQSRDVLARFGVPVPGGEVTDRASDVRAIAERLGGKVVVKAQVLMGGRGKAGGVKLASTAEEAASHAEGMLGKKLVSYQNPQGMLVERVLISQMIDIAEEYYLAVLLDRALQKVIVMISAQGGMDIEEVAAKSPEKLRRRLVDMERGLQRDDADALIAGLGLGAAEPLVSHGHDLPERHGRRCRRGAGEGR